MDDSQKEIELALQDYENKSAAALVADLDRADIHTFANNIHLLPVETAKTLTTSKVFARKADIDRAFGLIARNTIELGVLYEAIAERLKETGDFEEWAATTPYDSDTIRNYRNVAVQFRDVLATAPDGVLQRINMGAIYKLAVSTVDAAAGAWFFEQLMLDEDLKGDKDFALIARDVQIRERYGRGELSLEQAYSLVTALNPRRKSPPPNTEFIIQLARDLRVSWGGVVDWMNTIYLAWVRTDDEQRPLKTWAEVAHNGYVLQWADKAGATREVALKDATPEHCELYMQYRADMHRTDGARREKRERATARITRTANGEVVLTLLDGTIFPNDFSADTVLIDLILPNQDEGLTDETE